MAQPLRRVQIVLHFCWRQHIGADFLGLWIVKRTGGVVRYQPIPDRLIQTLLEQPVDVPHGMLAQSWVFGAFRAMTAKAPSLLQKISHLLHGQFRDRDFSQSGEDMVLEEVAVSCICGRTALGLVIGLLPAENIVFQRHISTSMHWRCRLRKATHGKPACFRIRLCR